jgi:hypothetical protein
MLQILTELVTIRIYSRQHVGSSNPQLIDLPFFSSKITKNCAENVSDKSKIQTRNH